MSDAANTNKKNKNGFKCMKLRIKAKPGRGSLDTDKVIEAMEDNW